MAFWMAFCTATATDSSLGLGVWMHVGGCQNCGPFLGTLYIRCRSIIGYPKKDHNFDNHLTWGLGFRGLGFRA